MITAIAVARVFVNCKIAVATQERPAALIFENDLYQERLGDTGVGNHLDLIDCSAQGSCNPPAPDIADRVIAYVAALPRNLSVLAELPKLKLYQSAWYLNPLGGFPAFGLPFQSPDAVPHGVSVAAWIDLPHYEKWCYAMADFIAASMFRWNYKLRDKESVFRSCAWAADAPLDCPPLTSLADQRPLRGMTFGVIGYGRVGSVMAKVMSNLGMRVVASKHHGPFTPTPPGLAWLSGDNDRVLRESDFVIITTPLFVPVINKTSLSLMKSTAVLTTVNPLNDNELDALYDALVNQRIGGAFLDAWYHGCMSVTQSCGPPYGVPTWPTTDKRILTLDNVQITGNNLDQNDEFWAQSAKFVAENLKALATGREILGVVRNGTSTDAVTGQVLELVQNPRGQGISGAIGSLACMLQLAIFGVVCFVVGFTFGSHGLWSARVSSVAIEDNESSGPGYAKFVG